MNILQFPKWKGLSWVWRDLSAGGCDALAVVIGLCPCHCPGLGTRDSARALRDSGPGQGPLSQAGRSGPGAPASEPRAASPTRSFSAVSGFPG